MHKSHRKPIIAALFSLWMMTTLIACHFPSTPTPPTITQTQVEKIELETPTLTATPEQTATLQPAMLFIEETTPPGLIDQDSLDEIRISDDPESPLWLGAAENAPAGEIITSANWVYALAAPFPTLVDETSLNDLSLIWHGHPHGPFLNVDKLYLPEILVPLLEAQWGEMSQKKITIYQSMPEVDNLWEENSWIILPFEFLEPKLKVISIEGNSPLFKGFKVEGYPLSFQFQLVKKANAQIDFGEASRGTLVNAVQSSNRDPNKMTTLVMTGVTALVRATAAKMEEKGLTYPGKDILHWLSEADLTHISNEVSFYEKCPAPNPQSRSLLFCSDPKYIELFDFVGADIIELTGNHNNDSLYVYGVDVVPFSLDLYEDYGMAYFAGGRDLEEAKAPLLVEHHGNQLAFIGCNAPGPDFAWATEEHGGAAPCGDYQWMVDEISRLRQEGYLPIATFQYYEDYYNFPEKHHLEDFGRIADAGAIIVNGSQAHRPKAMAFQDGTLIDYGLGNLFFDQMGVIDDYGNQILQTSWEKIQRHTFYNGQHLSTEILTARLEDYAKPRPMTPEERQIFLEEIFTASGWDSR